MRRSLAAYLLSLMRCAVRQVLLDEWDENEAMLAIEQDFDSDRKGQKSLTRGCGVRYGPGGRRERHASRVWQGERARARWGLWKSVRCLAMTLQGIKAVISSNQ
eukprot:4810419-Pleurochrysis_carterae.AAC.2